MDRKWILIFGFFIFFPFLIKAQEFDSLEFQPILGRIEGRGTHFEIKNSPYLNISLESSTPIEAFVESIPEMIIMNFNPISEATSTQITIKGLFPTTLYHKYEDNYYNHQTFETDENGNYTFHQDISLNHLIFIQPRSSTKHLNSENGGDCSLIGEWDPYTKTCALTTNLNETIQIDSDDLTLDGRGHTISGNTTGFGIYINKKKNVLIKNLKIQNFSSGIYIFGTSSAIKLENNEISNNWYGIFIENSQNVEIKNNLLSKQLPRAGTLGATAILFVNSSFNKISKNNIFNNDVGVFFATSNENTIEENAIENNTYNFEIFFSKGNSFKGNNFGTSTQISILLSSSDQTEIIFNSFTGGRKYLTLTDSNNNLIINNTFRDGYRGISFLSAYGEGPSGNKIYLNNFINIISNFWKEEDEAIRDNLFNSPQPLTYSYKGKRFVNYLGNFWSNYQGNDANGDGIGDTPFSLNSELDNYPLIEPYENYFIQQNLPKVLISEVYYDVLDCKEGSETNCKGKDPDNEWIILHNLEDEAIDISGWIIEDNYASDTIPQGSIIPAGGFAIITASSTTFDYWRIPADMAKIVLEDKRIGNGLANDGDRVILKNKEGNIIDAMSYGNDKSIFYPSCPDVEEGKSLLRFPPDKDTDTAEDFIESEPTIGKNQAPIPVINFSPKNPVKGIEVKFDASLSTDPDGQIVNFEWQIASTTLFGTTTTFTFQENGEYEITLIATDNDGATSSTSTILKVAPFSFAIITDLHIGRGYPDYDSSGFDDSDDGEDYYLTERLKNVVQWIIDNKDNIDCEGMRCSIKFLAVLGDIADSAEKSEFLKAKKILDRLNDFGIPYVPVFGNHDVWPYTDETEATSTLGEDYFEEIFWDENATNTKLMKEILGIERDESNKKFKNFAFNFGGINFIGLDFNSRTHVPSPGLKTGVWSEAENWDETINWLKDCLEEHEECLKGYEGNSNIIFSHHPFVGDLAMGFSFGLPPLPNELEEIREIIENKNVLANFGGHIHGFYDWWREDWRDANEANYSKIDNTSVITTETLMMGSNQTDEYLKTHDKGVIKIVKVFDGNEIDYKTNEGKYKPEIGEGKEFIALNPYMAFDYKSLSIEPCMVFKAHTFTRRANTLVWEVNDKEIGSGEKVEYCFPEAPQTYQVKLKTIDKNIPEIIETIIQKIEVKLGIIPKLLKITDEMKEKMELISTTIGENLTEFGRTMKDWILIKVKHSPSAPVGLINVHFEQATEDIDLTRMTANTDLERKKSILYMPQWPKDIEELKILFIPR